VAVIDKRVAVVTGANRGIGLEICRQLALRGLRVVLTSRDAGRGEQACRKLAADGGDIVFRCLDVVSDDSVAGLVRYIEKDQGRVDVLVNNAGIMIDPPGSGVLQTSLETFRKTMETNFFGALRLCQAIVPIMQRGHYGRIVNLSSGLGQLAQMGDGTAAYRASKAALNALTRMVAAAVSGEDILVNSMCPGWVRTELGGPNAARHVDKGAETAVWLAMLPHGSPSGGFFRDKTAIPW
jgi:NAD(P)-dependent dehydrogenase (short-subunit alcohol dehydrogenase family)